MKFDLPRPIQLSLMGLFVLAGAAFFLPGGSDGGSREAFNDAALAAAGGGLLAVGFVLLRKKRLIENLPSSKIRSIAMGFGEITGVARPKEPLVSPLTRTPCVYYRYTVEKRVRRGKGRSEWQTIEDQTSSAPFYVEDPTGRILVDPAGADAHLRQSHREIRKEGGFFSSSKRHTEWRLEPGQPIYVIGTVRKLRDFAQENRAALSDRLREAKRDPQRMAAFDRDRDGTVDEAEWNSAVAVLKQEVLREQVAQQPVPPQDNLVVGKGEAETTFLISNEGEAALIRKLNIQVFIALAAGLGMTAIFGVSLLARAGLLPARFIIDYD